MSGTEPAGRGVDHLGITVPDVVVASEFFVAALGAEVMYDLIAPPETGPQPPVTAGRADDGSGTIADPSGLAPGVTMVALRRLRLGRGATIELFQYACDGQRDAARAFDLGLQHFAVHVDDIDAAAERVAAAGGHLYDGPRDCVGPEAGAGARYRFTRLPWGTRMELITGPAPVPREDTASRRSPSEPG